MDDTTRKMFANTHNIELFLQQMNVARKSADTQSNRLVSDTSKDRLMIRFGEYTKSHSIDIRIVLTPETLHEAQTMFGNRVACQVMQNGTFILAKGESFNLTDNNNTGRITISQYSPIILNAYGIRYGVVYLKKTVIDGMMVLSRDEMTEIHDQSNTANLSDGV